LAQEPVIVLAQALVIVMVMVMLVLALWMWVVLAVASARVSVQGMASRPESATAAPFPAVSQGPCSNSASASIHRADKTSGDSRSTVLAS